jgi:hypothetical protein
MLRDIPSSGTIVSILEFKESFQNRIGFGHPVKDNQMETAIRVYQSNVHLLPTVYTHVIWFDN